MNSIPMPMIEQKKCTVCGICIDNCPEDAVHMVNNFPQLDHPENCSYCGICEETCPSGAIALEYEIS